MILQRIIRQQAALRAVCTASTRAASTSTSQPRPIRPLPQLTHGPTFEKHGIKDLLSPEAYEMAWIEYQSFVMGKLDLLTAGTEDETSLVKNLLLKYARRADKASLFNYASMAHNNHFFFKLISPNETPIPEPLLTRITEDFSSLDSLRAEFLNTANAMFGPGFVWLVSTETSQLRILATYIAGSPYAGAHFRMQPHDMSTQNASVIGPAKGLAWARQQEVSNRAGFAGPYSGRDKVVAPGGLEVVPLLCVNTWEHVWLRDHGVGGKREFLERWWDRINWEEVQEGLPREKVIKRAVGRHGQRF